MGTGKVGFFRKITDSKWGKAAIALFLLNEIRGMFVAGPGFYALWQYFT